MQFTGLLTGFIAGDLGHNFCHAQECSSRVQDAGYDDVYAPYYIHPSTLVHLTHYHHNHHSDPRYHVNIIMIILITITMVNVFASQQSVRCSREEVQVPGIGGSGTHERR